jgi:hypothetical protein
VPPIVTTRRRIHGLTLVVLCAALLLCLILSATANAASTCPSTTTAKAFTSFGDTADYSLVSNGAFETGTTGWSLTKAAVASGNETFKVHGSGDSKSLAMQAPGAVLSPAFCVSGAHPSFRFFARRTSGTWGVLYVNLRWTDAGGDHTLNVGALSGDTYKSWQPSPAMPLANTLPLNGGTLNVRLAFDAEDTGGAWAIDDVYIDPYRR